MLEIYQKFQSACFKNFLIDKNGLVLIKSMIKSIFYCSLFLSSDQILLIKLYKRTTLLIPDHK